MCVVKVGELFMNTTIICVLISAGFIFIFFLLFIVIFRKAIHTAITNGGFTGKIKIPGLELTGSADKPFPSPTLESRSSRDEDVPEGNYPMQPLQPEPSDNEENKSLFDMRVAIQQGNIEEAEAILESFTKRTENAKVKMMLSLRYHYLLALQGYQSSFDFLQNATKDVSVAPFAYSLLGRYYQDSNIIDKADLYFRQAIENESDPIVKAGYLVLRSKMLTENNQPQRAEEIIVNEIKKYQDNDKVLKIFFDGLSKIYSQNNLSFLKLVTLEKALEFTPNDSECLFDTAYQASECHFDELSLLHYSKLTLDDSNPTAFNNLGISLKELKLKGESINSLQRASQLGETLASANLAYRYMEEGFYEQAESILDEAITKKDYHENINHALSDLKNFKRTEFEQKEKIQKDAQQIQRFMQRYASSRYMAGKISQPLTTKLSLSFTGGLYWQEIENKKSEEKHFEFTFAYESDRFIAKGKMNNLSIELKIGREKDELGLSTLLTSSTKTQAWGYFEEEKQYFQVMWLKSDLTKQFFCLRF